MIIKLQSIYSMRLGKEDGTRGHTLISLGSENRVDFMNGLQMTEDGNKKNHMEQGDEMKEESMGRDGWNSGWYLGVGLET